MILCKFLLVIFLLPHLTVTQTQEEPCVMEATFEDGSINSGDPDINADPPMEGRIYTDDRIARNSKYSLVHKLKS